MSNSRQWRARDYEEDDEEEYSEEPSSHKVPVFSRMPQQVRVFQRHPKIGRRSVRLRVTTEIVGRVSGRIIEFVLVCG